MSVPAPPAIRERVLDAAWQITAESGWSAVTMARLADHVGVSRQTVYNEIGSKPALAQALVMRELDRFLVVVDTELATHQDVVEAIRSASYEIFVMAGANPLLHAVLSASHGSSNDLLPLLTTHSEALIGAAGAVIRDRIERFAIDLDRDRLEVSIDMVVRIVLSHVMQPAKTPAESADDIAWLVGRVLGSPGRQRAGPPT